MFFSLFEEVDVTAALYDDPVAKPNVISNNGVDSDEVGDESNVVSKYPPRSTAEEPDAIFL